MYYVSSSEAHWFILIVISAVRIDYSVPIVSGTAW